MTVRNAGPSETSRDAIIKFFFIVNDSGRDVKVNVRADHRTLFVQEIGASEKRSAAAEQAPPPSQRPARELKVAIGKSTKSLLVEEMNAGLKKEFTVADVVKVDGGFRIVIQEKKILISQDYFPVR